MYLTCVAERVSSSNSLLFQLQQRVCEFQVIGSLLCRNCTCHVWRQRSCCVHLLILFVQAHALLVDVYFISAILPPSLQDQALLCRFQVASSRTSQCVLAKHTEQWPSTASPHWANRGFLECHQLWAQDQTLEEAGCSTYGTTGELQLHAKKW